MQQTIKFASVRCIRLGQRVFTFSGHCRSCRTVRSAVRKLPKSVVL